MIGISYHAGGLQNLSLPEVIRMLSETGYDAIEMMCGPEAHIDSNSVTDQELKQVKSMVEDHGLKVAVINPYKGPGLYLSLIHI